MERLGDQVSEIVATVYNSSLFVEMIEDISIENSDVLVKFMSRACPVPWLKLSRHEDICDNHVMIIIFLLFIFPHLLLIEIQSVKFQ